MIMEISELLARFLQAELHIGGSTILWREIVGNGFGLASAILGMKRRVAAWPVGIVGNIVLFTVFLGGVFNTPNDLNLYGQAGRQIFFLIVSVYGFVRWYQFKKSHGGEGVGVRPKWAGRSGRLQLLAGAVVLTGVFYFILKALNSWGPLADAWILTGSILATYGMARGW
jgi:nicotinamide mononucleotide transporter